MGVVFRYFLFLILIVLIGFSTLFSNSFFSRNTSYIIQPFFKDPDYKYWSEVDGSFFCQEETDETKLAQNKQLSNIIGLKTNIIYFTNVDLIQCSRYLEQISLKLQKYNILIAIDLEKNFKSSKLYDANYQNFNSENYLNTFKEYSIATNWVSYIIIDDKTQVMTYLERRIFQSNFRNIFQKSFIGYKFSTQVKPTPQMTHPIRNSTNWDNFEPKDDDGDFIITDFQVQNFKRTLVFAQNISAVNIYSDGQFL